MSLRIVSLCMFVLCAPVSLWAMGGSTPIHIESDSLDIDDNRGISTYRGNVVFRQGGSYLWADEIVVYIQNRQVLEKIKALGRPARFKLVAESGGGRESRPETVGEAELIEYRDEAATLLLRGQARLSQAGNMFSGDIIEYDTEKRIVRAGRAADTESKGRVKVTILPRQADHQDVAP